MALIIYRLVIAILIAFLAYKVMLEPKQVVIEIDVPDFGYYAPLEIEEEVIEYKI